METNQEDDVDAGQVEVVTADEGIELLKKQLADEREARATAEREARAMAEREATAKLEVHDTNMHLLNASIEQMTDYNENLNAAYAQALARGDHAAAAKINDELLDTKLKLQNLKSGAEQLKQNLEEQQKRRVVEQNADPVEAFASALSKPSADWVRAHPDAITNPKLQRRMVRAHEDAIDEGIQPDTPDYFEYIENRLGYRKNDDADPVDNSAARQTGGRSNSAPPPAAPVSRGSSSTQRGVRLTPEQRAHAAEMGWAEKDYAVWIQDMKARGQLQ